MEYQVILRPSGHQFVAWSGESLLEAGLRAGLNLPYYCDNGSCGECLSRLVDGKITVIRRSEFVIAESRKHQGYFLPCSCAALSDLVVEVEELSDVTQLPMQSIVTRVRKIEYLQDDLMHLVLRAPRTRTLRYLAGQSSRLDIAGVGSMVLPIASCPCQGMNLAFYIRRSDSPFVRYLFESLGHNDEVIVQGPCGDFTMNETAGRGLIFIACDTGFASVKSLIEHAISLDWPHDMVLYRIACDASDIMRNICRSWHDAIDNFTYEPLKYYIPVDYTLAQVDQVCEELLKQINEGSRDIVNGYDVYLAGAEEIVKRLSDSLISFGLPARRLHVQPLMQ